MKKRGIFISASAGTGKTTRLVEEYLKVLEENPELDVDNIVAITYTRKAAREMKERIRSELTKKYKDESCKDSQKQRLLDLRANLNFAWISTIHSFCERILKENALFIPIDPGFQVLAGMKQNALLEREIIRFVASKLDEPNEAVDFEELLKYFGLNGVIELFKKAIMSKRYELFYGDLPGNIELTADFKKSKEIRKMTEKFKHRFDEFFEVYRKKMFEEAKLDFESLLFETFELLRSKEFIRQRYIRRFKYIFVDEFQDTNELQKKIIDLLHEPSKNFVLFVGDPKQSIYKFRGADVTVFTRTEKEDFDDSQKEVLEKNYRSHPDLVEFFNRFFPRVLEGGKELFKISYKPSLSGKTRNDFKEIEGKRVKILNLNEEIEISKAQEVEARLIARFIINRVNRGENTFKDFVILLRKFRGDINYFTKVFDEYSLPYYVVSSGGFYDRPEITAIISFLNVLNDPFDNQSFASLLLSPFFKMSFDELMHLKGTEQRIYEALKKSDDQNIKRFLELLSEYMKLKEVVSVGELVEMIINDMDYLAKLAFFNDAERMIINVKKFVEVSKDLSNEGYSLREFVSQMKRYSPDEEGEASLESEEGDVVRIMTIHKSKGLQFPVVIIPRIFGTLKDSKEDIIYDDSVIELGEKHGIIYLNPLKTQEGGWLSELASVENSKNLEEEKRILYVAMTRAKEELVLCGTKNKRNKNSLWGSIFQNNGFYDPDNGWIVPEEFQDLVEIVQSTSIPDQKYEPVEMEKEPLRDIPESVWPLKDLAKRIYISPTHIYGEINIDEILQLDEVVRADKSKDMGILVHEILEQVGNRSLKGTVTTLKSLRLARPRLVDEANFTEEDLKTIWEDLERWFDNPYIKQIEDSQRSFSELAVARKFKDRILYGVIDKIFLYNGEWIIADFKYANYNPVSEEKYKFQLLFYTYATSELFNPVPRKALLFYLKEKGEKMVVEYNFTEDDLKKFETEIDEKIEQFERTVKEWETKQKYTLGQVDSPSRTG